MLEAIPCGNKQGCFAGAATEAIKQGRSRSLRTELRPIVDEAILNSIEIDTVEEPLSLGGIIVGY